MKNGVKEGTGWAYYGFGGTHELLRLKSRQIEHYRLRHLNHVRKLAQKVATLNGHKCFLTAVASKRVKRVDRIIRLGLKQGRGIKGLLWQYLKAAKGLYKPKSFEEEDYLRGLVLWKLGGNRIASIAHCALGLPSITTLRNQVRIPPITLSPRQPTVGEVSKNVHLSFADMKEALKLPPQPSRKRNHHATNYIVGCCREHVHNTPIIFRLEKDVEEVFRCLANGRATIGTLGLLSDDHNLYAARGILISGDCKQETGEQHAKVLQTTVDGVNAEKEDTNIRVVSVASDGESRRGVALTHLTFKRELSPESDIYNELSPLPFMDLHVGDDDITADKDYKHIFKRLRNLLLRERGFVVGGTRITPSILKSHLQAEKVSKDHIRLILNPDDKQDVKLAYDLLKAVWSLPEVMINVNPGFVKARKALWTFGWFLYHLVIPYISIDLSLGDQLEYLSAATHSAMYLYMTDGKECLSTALYTDIVIMVKNVYFCVAKTKADDPDGLFWLILLRTDRLKELFGNLRTMVGNDANLDLLQVSWRLSSTTEIANILSKYPHWDRPPRRLQLPAVQLDGQPISTASDHLKPRCWDADLSVKKVTLQTSWAGDIPGAPVEFGKMDESATTSNGAHKYTVLLPHGKPLVDPQCTIEEDKDDTETATAHSSILPTNELAEDDAEVRVEVEDPIADEGESDHGASGTHTAIEQTITVNGKPVLKSRALVLWGKYKTRPASTN
ncbi:hypothetical protein FA13DRAFT_1757657 [Coprinellus micaceus]|uniref:Uncharacterized protein n=1 Tax=Coprinellus micaceus TaxID=71717 RepID=A0A4Y7SH45_COPMI|nr:hypothetical protein FA13DRAFT_1757657 [Coprinellus micaceus]